jgi:branched-chain amino acid transport system substrate-binding protein
MTQGMLKLFFFFLACLLPAIGSAAGGLKPVYIGLDAEFGRPTGTAEDAIKQGITIAIEEINASGGVLGGRKLALLEKDNRSVPARGKQNTREFGENPDVVAMFCGRFSTVVIETIETVHRYGIPLLDPWAASDKIVDNGFRPNYVFRLSLRDSWAVQAILSAAVGRGFKKIGVMTANVSWGRGNNELITRLAPENGLKIVSNQWFNYSDTTFRDQYRRIRRAGAEAVILVISETEGTAFVKEVAALAPKERLPILCHWSVTGSDFPRLTGAALFDLDFSVVQTYSFIDAEGEKVGKVLDAARRLFNKKSPGEIVSPVGLAHAYDLTRILARAIDLAGSSDRKAVRDALERVTGYDGLIKYYPQPFSAGRHEALDSNDVFMARYRKDGTIIRSE